MKILFLSDDFPPDNLGGAGAVAYNLAQTMKGLGHDVSVISTTQDKSKEGDSVQDGLKIHKIYSKYHRRWRAYLSLYNPQTVNKVSKIVADIKPDVVHAHNIHQHLSYHCLKIAKRAGASVFLTAHDVMLFHYGKIKFPKDTTCENYLSYCGPSPLSQIKEFKKRYNPVRNLVIRQYLKRYVDKVIAVSGALKNVLALNGITNVEIVHNGIDTDAYRVDQGLVSVFKKDHGLEDKRVILFGGRIGEEKGIDQMKRSLELILKEVPDALLLIAGSESFGAEEATLPIKFMGWLDREEMRTALAASDLVVFPSICFETFGLIALEAMAAKKPVIGTCFGGTAEVIVNGQTGYVVNPHDSKIMANKMAELLTDSEKNQEFGRRGYERARDFFNLRQQAEKYLNLF